MADLKGTKRVEKTPLLDKSRSLTYSNYSSPIQTRNKPLQNAHYTASRIADIRNKSFTSGFYPWVPTAEDVVNEAGKPVADKVSIFLMIFINFLSNVVFSIVLPSQPDFIEKVQGANSGYLNGWAVAANSLGTFIASPILGWWADKRTYKEVMIVSMLLMIGGNIWYALATDIYQLFAARFVVGIAAANYAPANSYLSYATSLEDRAKVMTWNSASSVLGFICGPSFSLVCSLSALQYTHKFGHFTFYFTSWTSPGYLSALLAVFGLFALIPFKEVAKSEPLKKDPRKSYLAQASMRSVRSIAVIGEPRNRSIMKGVIVCLFVCFAYTAAFTVFETTGPLYTLAAYEWSGTKGNFDNALLFLGISGVSLVSLALLQVILMKVSDERLVMIGFGFSLTAGLAVLFSWDTPYVSMTRFFIGVGVVAMGYASAQALLLVVFSKILEESEQGVMMGWMSSAGAVARLICPVAAGYAWKYLNRNYIYLSVSILTAIANLLGIIFFPAIKARVAPATEFTVNA
eukprot:TRINITY_DN11299_c0_g1_i1.p1 TRINITY_DN11299_c0_g1~~TRINITY_DN11299_c0_g1_i1.p1  ORF type:complete len:546 (+),score=139.67 TRINITY_DN11299_c0_g1_i1:88-1638(+)